VAIPSLTDSSVARKADPASRSASIPRWRDGKEKARECVRHDIDYIFPAIGLLDRNVKGAKLKAGRYKFQNNYKLNGDGKEPARRRR
jgi:hypothetical protein